MSVRVSELPDLEELSSQAMLALCEHWLHAPALRSSWRDHDLGIAMRARLHDVYQQLADVRAPHLGFELRRLGYAESRTNQQLQIIAERLHRSLQTRIRKESDPTHAARYRELMAVVFPDGVGSLLTLSRRMSGEAEFVRSPPQPESTRLQSVAVTRQTLSEAYHVWAMAQQEKDGGARSAVSGVGSTPSTPARRRARARWRRTVHALFTAIALLPVEPATRDDIMTFLRDSVVDAARAVQDSAPDATRVPGMPTSLALPRHDDIDIENDDTLDFDVADLD